MMETFECKTPILAEEVFVAPGAQVIGDVEIGAYSSIWFNAVVRGDENLIRIGERTNIQDLTVIHVAGGRSPAILEHDITVGHGALLHGCHLEHHVLIGMGAIVLDGGVIGHHSIVAAGAVVTEEVHIPPGTLALGIPARPKRDLTVEELQYISYSADHYVRMAMRYRTRTLG